MDNKKTGTFIALASMILIASFARMIPHPPNFTPVLAMALFGGAYFNKKAFAFIAPLVAMFLADLFIGFHADLLAVYASVAATVALGFIMQKQTTIGKILLTSIASSVLFFLITNFSSWLTMGFYTKDLTGLMMSYEAAIPFFRNTLAGTIVFSTALFGGFELLKRTLLTTATAEN